MHENKYCKECNVEKQVSCFHSFLVTDKETVSPCYSLVCEECKQKRRKETKIGKMTEEEFKEYNRRIIRKLRDDPEYRQKEKEYQAEKTTCECGSILRWGGYAKHKRSKSHQQRMNSIQLIQLIFILPSLDNNMKRMNPSRAESHVRRHCVML